MKQAKQRRELNRVYITLSIILHYSWSLSIIGTTEEKRKQGLNPRRLCLASRPPGRLSLRPLGRFKRNSFAASSKATFQTNTVRGKGLGRGRKTNPRRADGHKEQKKKRKKKKWSQFCIAGETLERSKKSEAQELHQQDDLSHTTEIGSNSKEVSCRGTPFFFCATDNQIADGMHSTFKTLHCNWSLTQSFTHPSWTLLPFVFLQTPRPDHDVLMKKAAIHERKREGLSSPTMNMQ